MSSRQLAINMTDERYNNHIAVSGKDKEIWGYYIALVLTLLYALFLRVAVTRLLS